MEPAADDNGMEKISRPVPVTEYLDLSQWHAFRDGLADLLGISIALYNSNGDLIAASDNESDLCRTMLSDPKLRVSCRHTYAEAVAQVIERNKTYIYRCNTNQYVFAVPVNVSAGFSLVIVGGRAYLAGTELEQFTKGTAHLGLDEQKFAEFRRDIRTIPPKSIFTLPNIVKNLAVPFFRGLYKNSLAEQRAQFDQKSGDKLSSLNLLDQVYRTIAPVLDREELYEAILSKSSELLGATRGSLMILDNRNNVLSVKASRGIDPRITDNLRIKIGEGISGSIVEKGLPVIVRDIETELPSCEKRPRYKTKSFVSVPLRLSNKVIGVINVSDKATGHAFSEQDMEMLLSFASFASLALERGAYYSMSEELKTLSMTDPLTGLYNRRYFRERILEEAERVKRHKECFSTFLIDIDNFKSFNDRFGHAEGDLILRGISRTILEAVRTMDIVARYGGEEFAVLLPQTTKKDAFVIAERIRQDIEIYRKKVEPFKEWPTISLGVAEFPTDARNVDDLIGKADSAMYRAKGAGKNRVVVYEG